MGDTGVYTIDDLARLSGVSVRTIRYYVQEGLIEAPRGRGPGAHFDAEHLSQLRRVRLLQNAGFDLETIRDKGVQITSLLRNLNPNSLDALEVLSPDDVSKYTARLVASDKSGVYTRLKRAKEGGEQRIPMSEGVDLVVRGDLPLPSPKDLVDIALLIRKIFGDPEK